MYKKFLIKRQDEYNKTYAKLWYNDKVIVFDNTEQIKEYIKSFPMFFKDIRFVVHDVDILNIKPNVLYSDIIHDKEFQKQKENIIPKYSIRDKNTKEFVKFRKYIVLFEDEKELSDFESRYSPLMKNREYEMVEQYANLGWYLFKNYKDLKGGK